MQGLETITDKGRQPRVRIKDHNSAYTMYRKLRDADNIRSQDRSRIMSMFDGAAPYNPSTLKALGQSYRSNLNFGEAYADLEKSLSAYVDLVNGVDRLANIRLNVGSDPANLEIGEVLSEEFHRAIIGWDRFHYFYNLLAHHFVAYGMGAVFFENETSWKYNVCGLGDFLVPDQTPMNEDMVEFIVVKRSYLAHELFDFIEDPKTAKAAGWDVSEVKEAIKRCSASAGQIGREHDDWEQLQKEIKTNELHYSYVRSPTIPVNHYYCRESDGSYSHFIGTRDGTGEFLFRRDRRFKKATEAFIFFPFSIGNGLLHSVRGLGHKIFPSIAVSNRFRNTMVDGALLSSTILLQPATPADADNFVLSQQGPVTILPPNVQVVPGRMTNIGDAALPILNDLGRQRSNVAGSYQIEASGDGFTKPRTAEEIKATVANQSVLTTSSMNLFYTPWQKFLKEVFRRMMNKNYGEYESGHQEVKQFHERLKTRKIDVKSLKPDLLDVEPVRAVGYGSPAQRLQAFNEFLQISGGFDEVGRQNLLRDRVAARVGYSNVDRYVPPPNSQKLRPTLDAKMANLENSAMSNGKPIPVSPDDLHGEHCRVHFSDVAQSLQMIEQNQQVDEMETLRYFSAQLPHCGAHLQFLAKDKSKEREVGQYLKILNLMREFVENTGRKIQAAQEQSAANGQSGQVSVDQQKIQFEAMKAQNAMAIAQAKAQTDREIRMAKAQQEMAINDAKNAQKITSE